MRKVYFIVTFIIVKLPPASASPYLQKSIHFYNDAYMVSWISGCLQFNI